ncbi:MAG: L-serine ammonia-lyase, iron-sulfur-dependent, subunit alpha [Eubacterium sp.]|jgi:L-serine dehydratase|uniref:L-serine ammonia-lyase, iron-sulfur-dependent, subunit alpha n=1 Tax=Eubacterium sp. F2 TaxID=3381348 RepID=UPI003907F1D6|nr:L-serine ammonia-lyase, iron-sulfur-dependent, subunit alpha [Eubacterium sp.]MCI2197380.1 L-serine ammonia-lyase, iron-sulfur-dependent, subunit alpha [Eubacterium sp.]
MDFKNAKELLQVCEENNLTISEAMKRREHDLTGADDAEITQRMTEVYQIMKDSARRAIEKPVKTMGGIIGGESSRLHKLAENGKSIFPGIMNRAAAYSMGVLEVNASMGLIVAAPTAGSSGVVPGVFLAYQEEKKVSDEKMVQALFNAGAIGYLAMRNATVAGAVGGCQAEIGIAAAMAASAVTELEGGSPEQCEDAASTVLMNMLGLVCDPVAGLVEYPCQNRNASGAANALVAAEIALAGNKQLIPLDQMIDTMYDVGRRLPAALRETALGGCAVTEAGLECSQCIFKS